MKETSRQLMEAVTTHPKTSAVVTTILTSNVWYDYFDPTIKALTSVFGLGVVVLVFVKHFKDLRNAAKEK